MDSPFAHLPPGLDARWTQFGITEDFFEQNSRWLAESRGLPGRCQRFFEIAATLMRLSRLDYVLGSVAFFQAVPGLERALSLHYGESTGKLGPLLKRAKDDGLIHDGLFAADPPLTARFTKQFDAREWKKLPTRTDQLVFLVPALRNQYFHGTYLLAPDYLHLTIQLRRIADALRSGSSQAKPGRAAQEQGAL